MKSCKTSFVLTNSYSNSDKNTLKFLQKLIDQFKILNVLILNIETEGLMLKIWIKKIIIYAINRLFRQALL